MKTISFLLISLLVISNLISSTVNDYLTYEDPLPYAGLVNRHTSIVLRPNGGLTVQELLKAGTIELFGSVSRKISFTSKVADDNSSVVLKPAIPFVLGEKVTVTLRMRGNAEVSYSFNIKSAEAQTQPLIGLVNELRTDQIQNLLNRKSPSLNITGEPNITVDVNNNPATGKVFMSNIVFNGNIPNTPHILIINNDGSPYYAQSLFGQAWDFKLQPSGLLTYYNDYAGEYYGLDANYMIVDTFKCGNGYSTDLHELRVLANGHALLLSYDPEIVDMSQIYPGGQTNATVVGLIIQEIDASGNVVFQWRSWDHFSILDATHENFTAPYIDYVHGNALELDNDGNIMLSSRHMDEITKINRQTGAIIWRLGGKNNQFTFINDPIKFSHQHAIRRIANGNITMFDNGNFHTPPHSRAVEYSLDEVNKTVTQVWQYRNTPDYYGFAMGYVERLSNGNTLISWGATNPSLTEVRPDGVKTLEMTFDSAVYSYRAYKYVYGDTLTSINGTQSAIPSSFSLGQNYPNPFNPSTKISFTVPVYFKDKVLLIVFDELGRQIATLVDKKLQQGKYEISWYADNYPSGVYFYRLEAGGYVETKKMILLK